MPYQFRIMANFADVYLNENAENCIKTYMVEERTMKILERERRVQGHLNFRGLHLKYTRVFEIIGLTQQSNKMAVTKLQIHPRQKGRSRKYMLTVCSIQIHDMAHKCTYSNVAHSGLKFSQLTIMVFFILLLFFKVNCS